MTAGRRSSPVERVAEILARRIDRDRPGPGRARHRDMRRVGHPRSRSAAAGRGTPPRPAPARETRGARPMRCVDDRRLVDIRLDPDRVTARGPPPRPGRSDRDRPAPARQRQIARRERQHRTAAAHRPGCRAPRALRSAPARRSPAPRPRRARSEARSARVRRLRGIRRQRLDRARQIVQVGAHEADRHPLRRLGRRRPRQRHHRLRRPRPRSRRRRLGRPPRRSRLANASLPSTAKLSKAYASISGCRLCRPVSTASIRYPVTPPYSRATSSVRQLAARADLRHDLGQRREAGPAVQPVPAGVVGAVHPGLQPIRKVRPRPRVPRPDMGARHVDHPPANRRPTPDCSPDRPNARTSPAGSGTG